MHHFVTSLFYFGARLGLVHAAKYARKYQPTRALVFSFSAPADVPG
jgi:hypothetical protein